MSSTEGNQIENVIFETAHEYPTTFLGISDRDAVIRNCYFIGNGDCQV